MSKEWSTLDIPCVNVKVKVFKNQRIPRKLKKKMKKFYDIKVDNNPKQPTFRLKNVRLG